MSRAKHVCGEDSIPCIFSGHDMPEGNRHRHAFYLPWDSNRDGHIDRMLVHVPDGMRAEARRIVEGVGRLWSRDGGEWRLVLESIGRAEIANALTQPSKVWESITPHLHPWHVKKRFDVAAQIKRECRERGLPEPAILEPFNEVEVGRNRKRRPIHFPSFPQPPRAHPAGSPGRLLAPDLPRTRARPPGTRLCLSFWAGPFRALFPIEGSSVAKYLRRFFGWRAALTSFVGPVGPVGPVGLVGPVGPVGLVGPVAPSGRSGTVGAVGQVERFRAGRRIPPELAPLSQIS